MARLKGNVIGNLKGKLGNLAARTIYGQTIISARPSSYNVNYSNEAVAARQKFAVTGAFSKAVLNSQNLREIWDKVRIQGLSTFNTIFKANYPFTSQSLPTLSNIITPNGFNSPVTSCSISGENIAVVLNPLSNINSFSPEEKSLTITLLAMLHTPTSNDDPPFRLLHFEKNINAFNFQDANTVEIPISIYQLSLANEYADISYFVTCITKTVEGKIVQYSATFSI